MTPLLVLLAPLLVYPACAGWSMAIDQAFYGQAFLLELVDTPRKVVAGRLLEAWLASLPASYLLGLALVEPLRRLLAPRAARRWNALACAAAVAGVAGAAAMQVYDLAGPAVLGWSLGAANVALLHVVAASGAAAKEAR